MNCPPRMLACSTHGAKPWTGQVICNACGAVWHLNVENPPTANGRCTCGRELGSKNDPERFTARAICADCYRQLRDQQKAGRS